MPSPGHDPQADWLSDYPPWDGLNPPHPAVAQAAYAYLADCDLKAAIPIMLGAGPYSSTQLSKLRHSREFWREVVAQIRQRRFGALAKVARDGTDRAAQASANAAAELEAQVAKWLTVLEESHAKRKGKSSVFTCGPEVVEW